MPHTHSQVTILYSYAASPLFQTFLGRFFQLLGETRSVRTESCTTVQANSMQIQSKIDTGEVVVRIYLPVSVVELLCEVLHYFATQTFLRGTTFPVYTSNADTYPFLAFALIHTLIPRLIGFNGRYCLRLDLPLKGIVASSMLTSLSGLQTAASRSESIYRMGLIFPSLSYPGLPKTVRQQYCQNCNPPTIV